MNVQTLNIKYSENLKKPFQLLISLTQIIGLEAAIWGGALMYLAFINDPTIAHFSICPFHILGFGFCPGCGLGNSVSYILHGEILKSFSAHPLGLFALIVLITRIVHLLKINWRRYGEHITINALS